MAKTESSSSESKKNSAPRRRRAPRLNLIKNDPWLEPYSEAIEGRHADAVRKERELTGPGRSLDDFANAHNYFGLHRNADGSYRDREIDIDIIAVDDVVYSSERLVLPHPRMRGRYFVLRPMVSLLPGWRHPATGLAVEDMLSECGDTENHACAE